MNVTLGALLSILSFVMGVTSQPITAVEGDDITLQCPLAHGVDLSACTVDVSRLDLDVNNNVVHACVRGKDHLRPQMAQYKDRTTLSHEDLINGILTLIISPVKLSDSGPYEVFVKELNAKCVIDLSVVTKDHENIAPVDELDNPAPKDPQNRTRRDDSSTTKPPVEEVTKSDDEGAAKAEPVWKTVLLSVGGCVTAAIVVIVLILLKLGKISVTSQPITAVEGDEVTLQCPLAHGVDLSAYTVDVSRLDLDVRDNDVHVYRRGKDHLQTQMAQYKDRTTLIHEDLTRGMLTLTLSPVKLSDSGPYKVYVPQLDAGCVIDLSVVTKDQENVAPVEKPLWKIVFHVCGCVAVIVLATFLILLKSKRICVTSQPITAVEGDDVTLRCPLAPGVDLSAYTVDVSRLDLDVRDNDVHVYRRGKDHLQTQMAQYKDRTTLIHEDLTRGILTLTLSSVKLSDSGRYKVYVPKLDAGCVIDLSVVTKDQENVAPVDELDNPAPKDPQNRTRRGDSSKTKPPVEEVTKSGDGGAAKAEPVWKTVLLSFCACVTAAAAVIGFVLLILLRLGKIEICKKKKPRGVKGPEKRQ
ncbi:hypothetical protein ABVT39_008582 [Epinephelus coioides]